MHLILVYYLRWSAHFLSLQWQELIMHPLPVNCIILFRLKCPVSIPWTLKSMKEETSEQCPPLTIRHGRHPCHETLNVPFSLLFHCSYYLPWFVIFFFFFLHHGKIQHCNHCCAVLLFKKQNINMNKEIQTLKHIKMGETNKQNSCNIVLKIAMTPVCCWSDQFCFLLLHTFTSQKTTL